MRITLFLLFFILFSGSIYSQKVNSPEIQKGDEYFNKEDYKNAFAIFSKAANEGNSYDFFE